MRGVLHRKVCPSEAVRAVCELSGLLVLLSITCRRSRGRWPPRACPDGVQTLHTHATLPSPVAAVELDGTAPRQRSVRLFILIFMQLLVRVQANGFIHFIFNL